MSRTDGLKLAPPGRWQCNGFGLDLCVRRSETNEVQKTWEYGSDRKRVSARHHAVRRQDEHGQSGSTRYDADCEGGVGERNQLHRYGRCVQPGGKRNSLGKLIEGNKK